MGLFRPLVVDLAGTCVAGEVGNWRFLEALCCMNGWAAQHELRGRFRAVYGLGRFTEARV